MSESQRSAVRQPSTGNAAAAAADADDDASEFWPTKVNILSPLLLCICRRFVRDIASFANADVRRSLVLAGGC